MRIINKPFTPKPTGWILKDTRTNLFWRSGYGSAAKWVASAVEAKKWSLKQYLDVAIYEWEKWEKVYD
jgi:hypothetical protein